MGKQQSRVVHAAQGKTKGSYWFIMTDMNFWNLIPVARKTTRHWRITRRLGGVGGLNVRLVRRVGGSSVSEGRCWGSDHHRRNAGGE